MICVRYLSVGRVSFVIGKGGRDIMRYHIGQYVVYKNRGVCKIENVGNLQFLINNKEEYYTLRPPFTHCSERIYIPVNTDVHMRNTITRNEAYQYLEKLKKMEVTPSHSAKTAWLTAHYQELLFADDINKRLQLYKEICQKERSAEEKGKKLGETDRRFKGKVERLLSEEFAVALNEAPELSKKRLYMTLQK